MKELNYPKHIILNFDPNNIEKAYFIPLEFFSKEGLKTRIAQEIELLRAKIKVRSQESVRDELNVFFIACLNHIKDKNLLLDFKLRMYELLLEYAQTFESAETLNNVIAEFEKAENKQILFYKFPYRANYIYGTANFYLFNILHRKNNARFAKSRLEILLCAKYYLLKIYSQYINKKLVMNEGQLENIVTMLSGCLSQSWRWFEPIYYLNLITKETDNPNIDYMKAINLNGIKDNTCLNYNGLLLLNIIDKCNSVLENTVSLNVQKEGMSEIKISCETILARHEVSLNDLREHKDKNNQIFESLNGYKKFCIEKQLYLNEHSFFCNCKHSTKDNLEIESGHEHTKIEWMNEFKPTLDLLVFDFINARKNYYNSLQETPLINFNTQTIGRNQYKIKLKDSFLKTSFKLCYSILDQMAYGILNAMKIDYNEHFKKKYLDGKKPYIYFMNIWDEGFFKYQDYKNNPYLIALYSISRDLDRNKMAALKDFKDIRNAFEHKLLFLTNEATNLKKSPMNYNRSDLSEKTHLLLILTKSAIYSYNNLLRRQSKLFEMGKL